MVKQFFISIIMLICSFTALAQQNQIRINALSLVGGKLSIEYERLLTPKIAFGAAFSVRPANALPFRSKISDIIDDKDMDQVINGLKTSNFSVTPEVRFYVSDKGSFRGFYLAPFVKYAAFDLNTPYNFDVEASYEGTTIYNREETISLDGKLTTYTAGLACGVNFKLANNLHLDWRIIGPGYGFSKGDVSGELNLNQLEQDALRQSLDDFQKSLSDLPVDIKMS